MDYLEVANSFATVIGLLSSWVSHRREGKNDYEEFFNWLKDHNIELSNQILSNSKITEEIKIILIQDRDLILKKFVELDKRMATLSCSFSFTRGLAKAIRPGAELSDQAIYILEKLVDSGGSWILEIPYKDGVELMIYDGDGDIEIKERRFLVDDLRNLVESELLLHDLNSAGQNKYTLTRTGYNYIKDYRSM